MKAKVFLGAWFLGAYTHTHTYMYTHIHTHTHTVVNSKFEKNI